MNSSPQLSSKDPYFYLFLVDSYKFCHPSHEIFNFWGLVFLNVLIV